MLQCLVFAPYSPSLRSNLSSASLGPRLCRCGASAPRFSPPLPASPSLFSFFCKNRQNLNPSFSISSTLFKKECSRISFPINNFRTLLQNTGGGSLSVNCQFSTVSSPLSPFPICPACPVYPACPEPRREPRSAILDDPLQLTENATTLSLVFATLT